MTKILKRIFIIILAVVILAVAGILLLFAYVNHKNKNYYKYATPAGEIEKKYTAPGAYDVSFAEFVADNKKYVKYEVWYPSEINDNPNTYPLVVMVNGTGVKASQYKEVFNHLASWGFIVVGNEDENSRSGGSSAASLDFMLKRNADENSEFYGKIDIENVGIAGHSQGGVGAINAVTAQTNGSIYKAMFTASATSKYWGQDNVFGAEWTYDASKMKIPYFMVAGTGNTDAGTAKDITATEGQGICPLWSMKENYNAVPNSITKLMSREVGKDHGDMLRYADGYMTAWFMYYLKKEISADFFSGDNAEILSNKNWQDTDKNL